ncbi:MAG TPA: hypothetical protein DCX75_15775, partial [Brevundimonas sp.]|nr:hypothetical protein [Brevundimonas sp.]
RGWKLFTAIKRRERNSQLPSCRAELGPQLVVDPVSRDGTDSRLQCLLSQAQNCLFVCSSSAVSTVKRRFRRVKRQLIFR